MTAQTITQEILKTYLKYNPETGVFTWIWHHHFPCRQKMVGRVAHSPGTTGYLRVRLLGTTLTVHRAAFLYMTGRLPDIDVDHIDGNTANNRWSNLRGVSKQ